MESLIEVLNDGRNIQSIKKSRDILGNDIITILDEKRGSFTIKSSRYIFGNNNKSFAQDGHEIISIKNSKDIFGNLETTVESNTDAETVAFLMKILHDCQCVTPDSDEYVLVSPR